MGSTTELYESWDRLSDDDLKAVSIIANNVKTQTVCQRMSAFLLDSLNAESGYRDELKTKQPQVPAWDAWNDEEVADAYFATVMIERASEPFTASLQQWASFLKGSVCNEMAARLTVRHVMTGGLGKCDN